MRRLAGWLATVPCRRYLQNMRANFPCAVHFCKTANIHTNAFSDNRWMGVRALTVILVQVSLMLKIIALCPPHKDDYFRR